MNKELTPLEVLEKIHDNWNCMNPNSNGCVDNDFKIIENALKTFDEYMKISEEEHEKLMILESKGIQEKSEKQEQVLKIIKEKWVDISRLEYAKKVEEYNEYNIYFKQELAQYEYDLLKEVLL